MGPWVTFWVQWRLALVGPSSSSCNASEMLGEDLMMAVLICLLTHTHSALSTDWSRYPRVTQVASLWTSACLSTAGRKKKQGPDCLWTTRATLVKEYIYGHPWSSNLECANRNAAVILVFCWNCTFLLKQSACARGT
ncbi:hypothetical protein ANANG_G00243630 [Anguilla anguilla]|uniref:Secreted protein n=1 Tax=Anguilla anguilla TaxID=7936 RepID=A0A9D3LUG4_ANGAN|nr:hypothetical protein ANANG_G00243630 [Anguilla anguilla]